ncbi:hypothetical protein C5167_030191 [Papaver somniferum]|nr:hypothetical protein C5167_030191 [Papaver somniferum]
MRCVVSNPESIVLRSGKESSILGCVELHNSEKIDSEARGLQNEVTHSAEKQRDKNNRSKPNAETSSQRRTDSHVYDFGINKHHELESGFSKYYAVNVSSRCLLLSSGGENVEEGNRWGEERPFQDHFEMRIGTKTMKYKDYESGYTARLSEAYGWSKKLLCPDAMVQIAMLGFNPRKS